MLGHSYCVVRHLTDSFTGKQSFLNMEMPIYWFVCWFGTYSTTCDMILPFCLMYFFFYNRSEKHFKLQQSVKLLSLYGLQNTAAWEYKYVHFWGLLTDSNPKGKYTFPTGIRLSYSLQCNFISDLLQHIEHLYCSSNGYTTWPLGGTLCHTHCKGWYILYTVNYIPADGPASTVR